MIQRICLSPEQIEHIKLMCNTELENIKRDLCSLEWTADDFWDMASDIFRSKHLMESIIDELSI